MRRPAQPQVHARRRACPSCVPRSRPRRARDSGLRGRGQPGRRHQRRQARGLQHVPGAARPRRRGHHPRAVLDHLSRGGEARRRRAGRGVRRPRRPSSGSPSSSSRRRARRAPRRCCSCRRATPPARCTRATRWRRSGAGRVEHGIWVLTDEIYEHLTYGGHEFSSMPVVVPELAEQCVVLNGVAKTYAMTGWRVGWMIGPADFTKAAVNLQSHQTSNVADVSQRAALAAVSGDLDAVAEMRAAFDRRGRADARAAHRRSPGSRASSRRARSTASPRSRACSAARSAGARPPTRSSSAS